MTERQQTERSAPTRARLLNAAARAFAARGFHATSTRDIAAGAGISPSAMYAHHASKEELLYLLTKAAHEDALAVVLTARTASGDVTEQLYRVVHDFAIHHAVTHVESRVANYELSALNEEHFTEVVAIRRAIIEEFRSLIRAGVSAGEFVVPHERLAVSAITSQCVDISRWYHESGLPAALIARTYAEMALRSLTPHRTAG